MSVYITREAENLVTVQITGTLRAAEWQNAQKMILDQLKPKDRISLLVVAEHFAGFAEGDWGNLTYQSELDPHVDKLAVVTDKEWQERAMLFAGKGFRKI